MEIKFLPEKELFTEGSCKFWFNIKRELNKEI